MSNKHKKNKKKEKVDISKLRGRQQQDAELRQYRKDLREFGVAVRPIYLEKQPEVEAKTQHEWDRRISKSFIKPFLREIER